MSEQVLITKEKLNNVANKVLDITGETSGKTLDELNTTLTNVNNEITTQEELIAQLQAAVDSLPEAGGGSGGAETCTVTFTPATGLMGDTLIVTYMNSSSQIATAEMIDYEGGSITCLKNSIIAIQNGSSMCSLSGGLSQIFYSQLKWAIQVSSDGTFYIR